MYSDIDFISARTTHPDLNRMFLSEIVHGYIWNSDYTLSNSRHAEIRYRRFEWDNAVCLLLGVF